MMLKKGNEMRSSNLMEEVENCVLNARHTLRYSWPTLQIVQSVKRKSQG